ncbi:MAG: serine/threonine protein kinase [Planctomycetota bacterium]|nr:MAG: serine/threonine protein kinase [Planctomycetota bacterium]
MLTYKDFCILQVLLEKKILPSHLLKKALQTSYQTESPLRHLLLSQQYLSLTEWEQAQAIAAQQKSWPDHPARIQIENQIIYDRLRLSGKINWQILDQVLEQAQKSQNVQPIQQLLTQKEFIQDDLLVKFLAIEKNISLACASCQLFWRLEYFYPWRNLACLFCDTPLERCKPHSPSEPPFASHFLTHTISLKGLLQQDRGPNFSSTFSKNDLFGHYKILTRLGKGGMGEVYKAYDLKLERIIALKVINPENSQDHHYAKRFQKERKVISTLQHPFIVPLYEAGEIQHRLYYTMGYIQGIDLRQYIENRGPMPQEDALKIMLKITDAIAYAHQQNVVHRDIKPANIMLDKHGHPHLLDFGLARSLSGVETRLTQTGAIVGSPEFMAPEQARGEKEIDYAADIYSLGALFYFLLTGRPPFLEKDILTLLLNVMEKSPPPLLQLQPSLHPGIVYVVEKCLEKEKKKRFSQAKELQENLLAILEGKKIYKKSKFMGSQLRRFKRWLQKRWKRRAS